MTTLFEAFFWIAATCVFYAYVGYLLILAVAARISPARESRSGRSLDVPVSVVLTAHNEEARIGGRVRELARIIASRPAGGELIVVSDGSDDRTVEEAVAAGLETEFETGASVPVRVLVVAANLGKANALNEGSAAAINPILVFADARQTWAPDAIDRLVANFGDPAIAAASGDLVIESAPGVMAGIGLYWMFEKQLRRNESAFRSMVSVTGSICAVRRELYHPIPVGTILDDVYWPLVIAMGGRRVVHESRAIAYDRLPDRARDEFRRKVRTLAGNFQLMARLPSALLPWRNRVWWQFISHRILRLAVPWFLLVALVTSAALPGPVYHAAFWTQTVFYILGVGGCRPAVAARSRLAAGIASFLVLNAAAWVAFWVWVSGRSSASWGKVRYKAAPPSVVADGQMVS